MNINVLGKKQFVEADSCESEIVLRKWHFVLRKFGH